MSDTNIRWLENIKLALYAGPGRDLYDVLWATLAGKKASFRAFLKMASDGYGISPSEGFGYALDQDWDVPETFDEVTFFLGDFESSSISPACFVELMQLITDAWLQASPDDSQAVELAMEKLRNRYS